MWTWQWTSVDDVTVVVVVNHSGPVEAVGGGLDSDTLDVVFDFQSNFSELDFSDEDELDPFDEPTGKFGPQVGASLFRPDNVYVEVSKTGTLTSDHFKIRLKNVFFPSVESKSFLLIDSWTGHCPDAVKSVKPSDNKVPL
ncbi:hypothetical protein PV328_000451 [Microctonus aethiopoides]|uniref:Uncharacterized protein n=1 Tax=Microctonus aethiopoides TaxID=144406 RepID=A0AA39KWG6_9HYME|nr:hypothetical protein PV328_000451 [Microctonus aethiopoides]